MNAGIQRAAQLAREHLERQRRAVRYALNLRRLRRALDHYETIERGKDA